MSKADEMKAGSRGVSGDMSPEAISHRFDILVELDRTAQAFSAARKRPARTPAPEPAHRIDSTSGDD